MVICYDGALAIPRIGIYQQKDIAVEFFNTVMCQLLLGGIICEALDTRDIVWGKLHKDFAIWPVDIGKSASSHLHSKLRMGLAGSFDSIILSKPNFIFYSDFMNSLSIGKNILDKIHNLTPSFLIRGFTEIIYKNWSLSLSSLWITIEQLTDYFWKEHFLENRDFHPSKVIPGRKNTLKEDNRTWSTSVKQEMLFQAGLMDEKIFQKLYPARQARNRLVHDGRKVDEKVAMEAYEAVIAMLRICSDTVSLPIEEIKDFNQIPPHNKVEREHTFEGWLQLSKKFE